MKQQTHISLFSLLLALGAILISSPVHAAEGDQWNGCEGIVMADQCAIHRFDAEAAHYATRLPYREGLIGLPSETVGIYYRNIRMKEFAEVIPAEHFLNNQVI